LETVVDKRRVLDLILIAALAIGYYVVAKMGSSPTQPPQPVPEAVRQDVPLVDSVPRECDAAKGVTTDCVYQ
jgi:hypothetical protein